MVKHAVYPAIVQAVKSGRMKEPFTSNDFREHCPGFGEGTYSVFLYKHREKNPGSNSELFRKVDAGKFELIRPLKYGLE